MENLTTDNSIFFLKPDSHFYPESNDANKLIDRTIYFAMNSSI